MDSSQVLRLDLADWQQAQPEPAWIKALEDGKVLHFPHLPFVLRPEESALFNPKVLAPDVRNISLDGEGRIKGVAGGDAVEQLAAGMVGRFRSQALRLVNDLLPHYADALRLAPTSYRPAQVETRVQSWRADDKRLHIDAFPSRPNRGERILRVFANVNPHDAARVWRVGEPFEDVARRFVPRARPYRRWQAHVLKAMKVTKSLRTEYDHLMLQLHDGMKSDLAYQQQAPQQTVEFGPGSVWVCFSDQTSHAVMAGQYMMEQTLHLQPARQYNPAASPLAILSRLTGRNLV